MTKDQINDEIFSRIHAVEEEWTNAKTSWCFHHTEWALKHLDNMNCELQKLKMTMAIYPD